MRETLTDIRKRLQFNEYKNEEHVRLSLVCRILYKLGWDIWNPGEVNTEFPATPAEDNTKVDIALFCNVRMPSIFMEVKAVGKMLQKLTEIERQVRDYNRNNTAMFSVITDGRYWRFYYSQTGGEFRDKCFKKCDLESDELDDIEQTLALFFGKKHLENGSAKEQANKYLQLTHKEKNVQEVLSEARRKTQIPSYPSLPQAVIELLKPKGITLTSDEVAKIIEKIADKEPHPGPVPSTRQIDNSGSPINLGNLIILNPDKLELEDLRWTKVEGNIGGHSGRKWNQLVAMGVKLAFDRGYDARALNAFLPTVVKEGQYNAEGWHHIEGTSLSIIGVEAGKAAVILVKIAKKLNCQLEISVSWGEKSPRAGRSGVLRWPS